MEECSCLLQLWRLGLLLGNGHLNSRLVIRKQNLLDLLSAHAYSQARAETKEKSNKHLAHYGFECHHFPNRPERAYSSKVCPRLRRVHQEQRVNQAVTSASNVREVLVNGWGSRREDRQNWRWSYIAAFFTTDDRKANNPCDEKPYRSEDGY